MSGTDLVLIGSLIKEAKTLWARGQDYLVASGEKYTEARKTAGGYTPIYRKQLEVAGVAERTEQQAIQCYKNPEKALEIRAKDRIRKAEESNRRNSRVETLKENKHIPENVPLGELHEAKQGFKAMIRKAAIAGDAGDWRTSHAKRTVAFAHFKKLLSASNLPALMGMTADEIIELIRTL